ncbi:uncharacterized protein LOC113324456 [Papaver somniferum]|uniref:uncharacterized protein LOC113324456 n=1 Tax=Papaver somniferum TaxID=3469 RepID=UPI000E704F07|nr:uncharacterized protein LOC113324456 [Papaver somniferum]
MFQSSSGMKKAESRSDRAINTAKFFFLPLRFFRWLKDSGPKTTYIEDMMYDLLGFNKETNSNSIPLIDFTDDLFEESLNPWRFSLIGRLNLQQIKFINALVILRKQWKLVGNCKLIPLGRGFFTIKLDNETCHQYIKEGTWEVLNQICKEIGTLIKLDESTVKCEVGYYANVLVEVNFAKTIPNKIWIGTKYGGFFQSISIPFCPKFCSTCKIVGHLITECRIEKYKNQSANEVQSNSKNKSASTPVQQQNPKSTPIPFDICDRSEVEQEVNILEKEQGSTSNTVGNQFIGEDSIVSKIVSPGNSQSSNNLVLVNMEGGRFSALDQFEQKEDDVISVDEEILAEMDPQKMLQIAEATDLENSVVKFVHANSGKVTNQSVPFTTWTSVVNSSGSKPSETEVSKSSTIIKNNSVEVGNVLVSGVHAHVKMVQRRFIWSEIQLISDLKRPWLVIGDFNAILTMDEKVGGNSLSRRSMLDFSDCVNACELLQVPKVGLDFNWSNYQHGLKRLLCNLDRAMFNMEWLRLYSDWGYKVGVRVVSDHSPLMGGCVNIQKPSNVPLRFQKIWLEHEGFMKVVEDCWSEPVNGDPSFIFMYKLKKLRGILKEWNWKVFGNVQHKIREAEEVVKQKNEEV